MAVICTGPSDRHLRKQTIGVNTNFTRSAIDTVVRERPSVSSNAQKNNERSVNSMKISDGLLVESTGMYIFDDRYGIGRIDNLYTCLVFGKDLRKQLNQVFVKQNNSYYSIQDLGGIDYLVSDKFNNNKLFVSDNQYYGFNANNIKSVKLKSILISYRLHYLMNDSMSQFNNADLSIECNNIQDILNIKVKKIDDFNIKKLVKPEIGKIAKGNKYYLIGKGIVKVKEVFDYPSKKNLFCNVENDAGDVFGVDINATNLYYIPYKPPKDIFTEIDINNNELLLQPFVERDGNTYNIYWKKIEDAAEYKVHLYKVTNYLDRKELYHLKDFVIDRNECYLAITNLVGTDYIFKVSAENRNGEQIAMSRGMNEGIPHFFVINKED